MHPGGLLTRKTSCNTLKEIMLCMWCDFNQTTSLEHLAAFTHIVSFSARHMPLLLPLALQPAVGFCLSNNTSPFFPILHQLFPSSHSQHLKISFYFLLNSIHSTFKSWKTPCNYQNIYPVLFCPLSLNLSSLFLCSTFVTISFLLCGVVNPMPNPQSGGPGYPFLSAS